MSDERPPIRFDEFVLDRKRCELLRAGEAVPLRPKTLAVLLYLVENADRVVSKQELLRAVWPEVRIEMQGVYQSVAELRAAFRGRDFIRTVRGTGYRWIAEPADGRGPVPEFRAPRSGLGRAGARRAFFLGTAVVVAVLVTARLPAPSGGHWLGDPTAAGDPEALVERARGYYAEGQFDVVEDILSAAVAEYPRHLGARLGLAQALQANGQEDRAFEMAQALHQDAIGSGAPHIRMESALLLSDLRHARDDPALARAYARETVELATLLHNPVVAGAAHERLGDLYLAEGRRSLAAIELQAAARRYRGLCPSSEERVDTKLQLLTGRT